MTKIQCEEQTTWDAGIAYTVECAHNISVSTTASFKTSFVTTPRRFCRHNRNILRTNASAEQTHGKLSPQKGSVNNSEAGGNLPGQGSFREVCPSQRSFRYIRKLSRVLHDLRRFESAKIFRSNLSDFRKYFARKLSFKFKRQLFFKKHQDDDLTGELCRVTKRDARHENASVDLLFTSQSSFQFGQQWQCCNMECVLSQQWLPGVQLADYS